MPTQAPLSIYDLPDEVISHIFDFLRLRDLLKTRLVDWRFKQLSDMHPFWKRAVELYFPHWQVESCQAQAEPISCQAIFAELHQAFFIGLTQEECKFFNAVLSNNLKAVDDMLKANPFLIKVSSASGYRAIYYAAAYQRDELFKVLRSYQSPMHRALDYDVQLGLQAREAYQSQKWLKESIKQTVDQLYPKQAATEYNLAGNYNIQLDEQALAELKAMLQRGEEIERQEAQRKNKKHLRRQMVLAGLSIAGLFLVGLGISFCAGAPLWLTLLGATASTVGYISLGLGICALLGTLMGLAWLYQDKLIATYNHTEESPLLEHETVNRIVPTNPVTPPENTSMATIQPSAPPTYAQPSTQTADSSTNLIRPNAVSSATAQQALN